MSGRTPTVIDGYRDSRTNAGRDYGVPTAERAAALAHAPAGKRVYASDWRGLQLTLLSTQPMVVNGTLIPERIVKVMFRDFVLVLDPKDAKDQEKIELLEKHEFYGSHIWDREARRQLDAEQRAAETMSQIEAQLQDPVLADKLRQVAGKRGFNLDPVVAKT